jgi:hypothetical protein
VTWGSGEEEREEKRQTVDRERREEEHRKRCEEIVSEGNEIEELKSEG